jgi:hypothetical protein
MKFTDTCTDHKHRAVRITSKVKFEVPAQMQIRRKFVSGKLIIDKSGFKFVPNPKGENYDLWVNPRGLLK